MIDVLAANVRILDGLKPSIKIPTAGRCDDTNVVFTGSGARSRLDGKPDCL